MYCYSHRFSDEDFLIVILVLERPVLSLFTHLKGMCVILVVAFDSHLNLAVVHVETDIKLFARIV
jgi:hypothetical protein